MPTSQRYRTEGDHTCIDMVTKSARQLFDLRDPAPFRERDLDAGAVEYLLASARDIGHRAKLRVVIRVTGERDPVLDEHTIHDAIRAHLTFERARQVRLKDEMLRRGRRSLAVGALALTVLLSIAALMGRLDQSHVVEIAREGLTISAWVVMWRPLELLLYEWWPHAEARRVIDALLAGEIVVLHDVPTSTTA